jgi:hypothetical protein
MGMAKWTTGLSCSLRVAIYLDWNLVTGKSLLPWARNFTPIVPGMDSRLCRFLHSQTKIKILYTLNAHVLVYCYYQPYFFQNYLISKHINKPLAHYRCGFESCQGLFIVSCTEAIQLVYRTLVVLLRCPLVPEIMFGGVSEVFLHQ